MHQSKRNEEISCHIRGKFTVFIYVPKFLTWYVEDRLLNWDSKNAPKTHNPKPSWDLAK